MNINIKNAKLIKIGDSYGLTIPKSYINHEIINLSKKYDVELKEVKEGETNEQKYGKTISHR